MDCCSNVYNIGNGSSLLLSLQLTMINNRTGPTKPQIVPFSKDNQQLRCDIYVHFNQQLQISVYPLICISIPIMSYANCNSYNQSWYACNKYAM